MFEGADEVSSRKGHICVLLKLRRWSATESLFYTINEMSSGKGWFSVLLRLIGRRSLESHTLWSP